MRPHLMIAALATIVILFAGGVLLSAYLSSRAIDTSQHQWCSALELLTKTPVPKPGDPKANPSRENAYLFYSHLRALEREFKCSVLSAVRPVNFWWPLAGALPPLSPRITPQPNGSLP